jgi:hypothetical protein
MGGINMSYKFKEIWCNKGNFTEDNRKYSDIDTLVIHYTGNDGDTAANNGNYFKNNVVETSAHYFVDDTTVVRSVADKNIAWHAGDWDINCRSIGIEIAGSTTECTGKTLENVILLTQRLMKKYNISKDRVIRHYDANGKICPGFWCGSAAKDKLWKEQFLNKLESNSESKEDSKVEKDDKPTIEYCVFAGGKWLPTVKGLSDFAGIASEAISGLAIKVTKGKIKYRVHIKGGNWLSWVTGFNLNDDVNGYAGILGMDIDAVQIYYTTPADVKSAHGSYYKATYRVSAVNEDYYDWQHDDEKDSKQDGYAGTKGKAIDRIELTLT